MKRKTALPMLALLVFGLLAGTLLVMACGNAVPKGAIASVGKGSVSKSRFDELIAQAKTQATSAGGTFPATDSTEYKQYAAKVVDYLVQQEVIDQQAKAMNITVADQDVTSQITRIEKVYGGETKFLSLLKQQGMTMDYLTRALRAELLAQKVYEQVVADVTVTDQQLQDYWKAHSATYQKKETRTVRHVLVSTKAKAEKVRTLLVAGSTWKKVAKQYSTDASSKNSGGSLGAITKGTMVAAFDRKAFSLKKGVISQPVKASDGWHIIQMTAIRPAKSVTFARAKGKIRQTLLKQAQKQAWQDWIAQATKDAHVKYAAGYDPQELSASPSPSASTG